MVFEGIKSKYNEFKEDRQFKKELMEDLKARDVELRKAAKIKAREQFAEERKFALEQRQAAFVEQERKKYNPELAKLQDTRTGGQKFKEGLQKIGEKASNVSQKIGSDSSIVGRQLGTQTKQIPQAVAKTQLGQRQGNVFFGSSPVFTTGRDVLTREKVSMQNKLGNIGMSADDKLKNFLGSGNKSSGSQNISNLLGMSKSNENARDKIRRFL